MCRQFGHWTSEMFASLGLDWIEQGPSWKAGSTSNSEEIVRTFMEPRVSLPRSQQPATCPRPEPFKPVHAFPTDFFKIQINISSHLLLGLPCSLVPSGCPTKTLHTPLWPRYVPNALYISLLDLITQICLVRSRYHEASRYAVASSPVSSSLLRSHIFLSTHCSRSFLV